MLYLPILVPNFWQEIWCQNMQKVREVQGEHPWNGHIYCWGKMWPKLDVGCEGSCGREGAPLWTILTNRRLCMLVTPFDWGVVPVR